MANAKIHVPLGADPYSTSTTKRFELGQRATGSNNTTWVYCGPATEALVIGRTTCIKSDWSLVGANTALANTTGTYPGWPQVAFAKADYGWVAQSGGIKVLSAATVALAGSKYVFPAGTVNSTSGHKVSGVNFVANTGAASIAVDAMVDPGPSFRD